MYGNLTFDTLLQRDERLGGHHTWNLLQLSVEQMHELFVVARIDKVYGIPSSIGSSKDWPYHKFYKTDGKVNMEIVAELMAKLKIAPEGGNENKEEEAKDQ